MFRQDDEGNKFWTTNGRILHRVDGPAVELASGTKAWYINGRRHRTDGPAIERCGGSKEWFINGLYLEVSSQEEFEKLYRLKAFW